MCGIAGFCGFRDEALLREMLASIAHRGPDDEGTWVDNSAAVSLGHRRLSIIDLSSAGHQPMSNEDSSVVIVYNGELYNFREIRARLESKGVRFKSGSDTEVLLRLYVEKGAEMLGELNGIFAFAIWDARKKELFIARDGLGVKPLYYSVSDGGFIFASEMKAILRRKAVDRALNPQAVHAHLSCIWAPSPMTMLKSVHKLEPGHALLVKDCAIIRKWEFYDIPHCSELLKGDEREISTELARRLEKAVERQMMSDVPVGAFLSGGLDSSAVVAFAQKYSNGRKTKCFTIEYDAKSSKEDGFAPDLPYAKLMAQKFGLDLGVVKVRPNLMDRLPEMVYYLDEPQGDIAPLNVLIISELARREGVKVLLSGTGGDDIFSGYRRHLALKHDLLLKKLPQGARRIAKALGSLVPTKGAFGRRLAKYLRYADLDMEDGLVSYFLWMDESVSRGLYSGDFRRELGDFGATMPLKKSLGKLAGEGNWLNKMLYLEGKYFLPDHNLNFTDKMGMAAGVEIRVPFLDYELVEFASKIPPKHKVVGNEAKYIFKKAMEPFLPGEIIYRPKTGFSGAVRGWLHGGMSEMVNEVLGERSLKRHGIFDPKPVANILAMDKQGKVDAAYSILTILCVELWCSAFLDGNTPTLGARNGIA
ncbi:MAG: asparagine synthase (glutamine-hydrolyzing) [Nitrospinae bacterium]|nr:asparagine synthase (glutamine-hydrolyzing) [Nitrospinota bacterium]